MSFKLIIITPPASLKDEIRTICILFDNGLEILHLRKPGFTKKEFAAYLAEIPTKFHKRIVIHSHYALLGKFRLKGIHLTEKTRKKKLPGAFRAKAHTLSASFHSIADILNSKRKYDYVFLSPIFSSISKKGYQSRYSETDLREFLNKTKNTIALGGISPATIKKTQQLNFIGAAALGFIWENKDALGAYTQLSSKIK